MRSGLRAAAAAVTVALIGTVLTVASPIGAAEQAEAAVGSDFDPGYIVSDSQFYDGDAMNVQQVQAFLEEKNGTCVTGYTCIDQYRQSTPAMPADAYCEAMPAVANESAASIIARVGAACDISQRFLLVLLEKEQSLVSLRSPSRIRYERATGFACPDFAPCDSSVGGFFYQVYYGARQFQRYATLPGNYRHRAGVVNNVLFHPNTACGSSPVFIRNVATAGLYNYTPFQPNASALANLYGSGNSCAAYGNRNTWRMWTDWFGDPTTEAVKNDAFVRDSSNGRIYLLAGGRKHYVPTQAVLARFSKLGGSTDRTSAQLAAIPNGSDLGVTVRDASGASYLVDQRGLMKFSSCAQMQQWSYSCSAGVQLDDAQVQRLGTTALNSLVRITDGSLWLVQSGTRRQVADPKQLAQFGFSTTPTQVTNSTIARFPVGHPVVVPGDIVRSADRSQYRIVGAAGRVYSGSSAQVGLRFLWDAPAFTAESLRLLPATAGVLPDRFRDAGGSWLVSAEGVVRVNPAQYGGTAYFPAANADLRAALPSAGSSLGAHFVRPVGSNSTYLISSGTATPTTSATYRWFIATFGVPSQVLGVSRTAIDAVRQPSSFVDGTLIRSPQGHIYLMDGGNALHVPDLQYVAALGLPTNSRQVTAGIMAGLESRRGRLDSFGIRIGAQSFVARNGVLHPYASNATRTAWGLRDVRLESLGSRLKISGQRATTFVQNPAGNVFLLEAGKRRPVGSVASLVAIGGATTPRLTLSAAALAAIPLGTPVPAPARPTPTPPTSSTAPALAPGSLVMVQGRPEVWLIDGDRRRHLGSFDTSMALGLGFQSRTVSANDLARLPIAAPLSSSLILCGDRAFAGVGGSVLPLSNAVRAQYPASAFTSLRSALCAELQNSATPMSQFLRAGDGKVYYVESGVRHWLGAEALTRLGGAGQVITVDNALLAAIPRGVTWSR